jgi:hypothetical protein
MAWMRPQPPEHPIAPELGTARSPMTTWIWAGWQQIKATTWSPLRTQQIPWQRARLHVTIMQLATPSRGMSAPGTVTRRQRLSHRPPPQDRTLTGLQSTGTVRQPVLRPLPYKPSTALPMLTASARRRQTSHARQRAAQRPSAALSPMAAMAPTVALARRAAILRHLALATAALVTLAILAAAPSTRQPPAVKLYWQRAVMPTGMVQAQARCLTPTAVLALLLGVELQQALA